MKKYVLSFIITGFVCLAAGCGQTGPLYLPVIPNVPNVSNVPNMHTMPTMPTLPSTSANDRHSHTQKK